jgi:hypothetical protein
MKREGFFRKRNRIVLLNILYTCFLNKTVEKRFCKGKEREDRLSRGIVVGETRARRDEGRGKCKKRDIIEEIWEEGFERNEIWGERVRNMEERIREKKRM